VDTPVCWRRAGSYIYIPDTYAPSRGEVACRIGVYWHGVCAAKGQRALVWCGVVGGSPEVARESCSVQEC
jgi:hypothetical protein